ncbi:MAG: type VI secretion system baseplate subunit TssE [Pirellulales bacterium]
MTKNRPRDIRAWPSLIDRIAECSPATSESEAAVRCELPAADPHAALKRDLSRLLNTTALSDSRDLSSWSNVRMSVLNYGVPEITGRSLSSIDPVLVQRRLKRAIELFEPRLRRESLDVRVLVDESRSDRRSLLVSVAGECIESMGNDWLEWQVTVDIHTGRVQKVA